MKLTWVLCLFFIGNLYAADPIEERTPAESGLGSGYMMAFPMNDEDQIAEESAESAVKTIAEALAGNSDDDDKESNDAEDAKEPVVIVAEEEKKDGDDDNDDASVEPVGILEAQLAEEEGNSRPPRRPLFKRPKIEELRKILGFPSENGPQKSKEFPPEKPKMFSPMFAKNKPKMESTPNGFQISLPLRREDKMRPFGFPMLPRNDGIRPIGFPDLVQAASSIIRRAIIDDIDVQDVNDKNDKDDEDDDDDSSNDDLENNGENEDDDEDEEDDDENVVIVPIPDGKVDQMSMARPLFRRFPLPLPFPVPRQMPAASRPRLPVPPLAPVALFLPLAQQIMNNIMSRPQARSQPPPMLPLSPMHHLIPIQPPMQNLIPIMPVQQNMIPVQQQQQQQIMHHMIPVQSPIMHMPQQSMHAPILIPLPNVPRPVMRPMPRRMPMQQPHPTMARRMPVPNPMVRAPMPQPRPHFIQQVPHQFINPMFRGPVPEQSPRVLPRMIRPPQLPLHPVMLMMSPFPSHVPLMPQPQHQIPVFHRPQQIPIFQQQMPMFQRQMFQVPAPQEEERVIFVREDPEEENDDDDQEVLLLVPTDEVEQVAQRPPVFMPHPPVVRPPVMSPLQRIRLLRELLMARQANRQAAQMRPMPMPSQLRSPRIVEIVQQQLRIIPAHHHQQRMIQQVSHPSRADASELHPVYVPYPHSP